MSNINTQHASSTQNSSVAPPQYLNSALQSAVGGANSAFGQGFEQYNQGAGRDLVGQQLRGDFLLPDSNPYLQETFNRGADAIQNRLDTQFSGSGRNLGASIAPAKADLSSFANQLYGGNYANERQIQQGSLNQVSQFDPLNQFISRLGLLSPAAGRETSTSTYGKETGSPLDIFGALFG